MRKYACIAIAAALASFGAEAQARSGVEVGHLECRGQATSYVVASLTELECVYRPHHGRPEPYLGQIRRVGVDIGWNQSTRLAWAVFAPTKRPGPGSLEGVYVGGSANATVGIGIGANALFGGSDSTISLQPLSLQGQVGIGAAGGISAFALRAEQQPRRSRRGRR